MTELPTAQAELLRHIAEASATWARSGRPTRSFVLLHFAGTQPVIDHPGWDSTWATPSERDIDDLAKRGLIRVDPPSTLSGRAFGLSVSGAQIAATLDRANEAPDEGDEHEAGMGERRPTAFVSWAHDDSAWESTVFSFVRGLYANGIAAELDLFHLSDPRVNWADYGPAAIEAADYVLLAVSAAYKRRWDGSEDPSIGAGAASEANTLKAIFADHRDEFQRKVKIVLLPGATETDIPLSIKAPVTRFTVDPALDASFEDLVRMLTGQDAFLRPTLSPIPDLPPRIAEVSATPDSGDAEVELREFIDQLRRSLAELGNGYLGSDHAHLYGVVLSKVKTARPYNEYVSVLSEPQPTALSGVYRPTASEARAGLEVMRSALGVSSTPPTPTVHDEPEHRLQPALLHGRIFPNNFAPSVDTSEKALVVRAAVAAQLPRDPTPEIGSDDEQAFLDLVSRSSLEDWALQHTRLQQEGWRVISPSDSYVVTLRRPGAPVVADGWKVDLRAFMTVAPYHRGTSAGHGYVVLDVVFRPTVERPSRPAIDVEDLFALMLMLPTALIEITTSLFRQLNRGAESRVLSVVQLLQSYSGSLGGFVAPQRDGWARAEGSNERQGGEWEPNSAEELESVDLRAASLRAWFKKLLRDSGIRGHDAMIESLVVPNHLAPDRSPT